MSITIEDVKKLAKLSRLEFTEAETAEFVAELEATLAQVDAINKVELNTLDYQEGNKD